MQKEMISSKQAISILILFMFGSSVVFGVNVGAGQDSWISLLIAFACAIPLFIIYARITKLFPEKDIYDIAIEIFGTIIGKIIIALITWYAIHLAAILLCNFSQYVQITAMPETPQLPLMIIILIVTVYIVLSGIETFGKWSLIILPLVVLVSLFTLILSTSHMDMGNFLPIMEHSYNKIFTTSFQIFAFPFGETALFLTLICSIKKDQNPYKIYMYGIILSALILGMIFFINLSVLGSVMMQHAYFPSFEEARVISIGSVLERMEGTISYNFILAGMVKISVCIFAASKGIAKLFNIENYRYVVFPTSLLILAFGDTIFANIIELNNFIKVYCFYVFPFQVIIPLLIWITAEVKKHKKIVIYAEKKPSA